MIDCKRIRDYDNQTVERFDFGVVDSKGRKIGAKVDRMLTTYVPLPEDHDAWYCQHEVGVFPSVRVHATRDGAEYGATKSVLEFETDDQREAYIAKYLRDAAKRAAKAMK